MKSLNEVKDQILKILNENNCMIKIEYDIKQGEPIAKIIRINEKEQKELYEDQ
jgi:hypothetical protein